MRSMFGDKQVLNQPLHVARCHLNCSAIPGPDCSCGIYYFADAGPYRRSTTRPYIRIPWSDNGGHFTSFNDMALTLVEPIGHRMRSPNEEWYDDLGGTTQVMRAEAVRIRAILAHNRFERHRGRLEQVYGVPLFFDTINADTFDRVESATTGRSR